MPDPNHVPLAEEAVARRFLTFSVDERRYAVPAEHVAEVIRVPPVARVPHAPRGLLGLANLRGSVLPVASLRGLLGRDEAAALPSSRAIVLDGAVVALVVDAVQALVAVDAGRIERRQAELAAEPGERLDGAFWIGADQGIARILDVRALVSAAFAQLAHAQRSAPKALGAGGLQEADERQGGRTKLVTFCVAGQEYAFGLDAVREIVPLPDDLSIAPGAEALVLGMSAYRDILLPILSLRGLLGFPPAAELNGRQKVVVVAVAGVVVGLVVDRMRAIVAAEPGLVEPVPPVLAARAGGEAKIKAMYRGEAGRRLISILAPEQLFREEVMQRLRAEREAVRPRGADGDHEQGGEEWFLIFRLGDDEFGLPIGTIEEVARLPDQVTRLPNAPKFLEGVVNLRGEVLPVVDQRRRFEMPALDGPGERRRLVVVRTERYRAGLIVDSVSEVLAVPSDTVEPTPALTEDMARLVRGILNLENAGRMVLLLDPTELLSRAERGLLDAFIADAAQAGS